MERSPKPASSQTFQDRILSSSSLNNRLISRLSATSDASRELRETNIYIIDLQARIDIGTKNSRSQRWTINKLRSEYEGLRDGSTNRFLSRLAGKTDDLAARTLRAEQAYEAVFEEQTKLIKDIETYKQALEETQQKVPHLEEKSAIYSATESELDDLYTSIFSLPHAEYPQEVDASREIAQLQAPISNLQKQMDTESQALKLLGKARKYLVWCNAAILNAYEADAHTKHVTIEAREICINIVRNAMNTAQLQAAQAETAYTAAQAVQPSIQNMNALKILEERAVLGPSFGDGTMRLLESKEMKERIKACAGELVPAIEAVGKEGMTARRRLEALGVEKAELEAEAREVLRRARGEVIRVVVERNGGGGEGSEAAIELHDEPHVEPPGYTP